jgi:hypothetical protein
VGHQPGEVPSPSTPSMSDSRLSWPLTLAGVPVMFRRSSGSSPISKRSIEPTALLRAMYTPRRTHVRSLARMKPGVQIPSPPPHNNPAPAAPHTASSPTSTAPAGPGRRHPCGTFSPDAVAPSLATWFSQNDYTPRAGPTYSILAPLLGPLWMKLHRLVRPKLSNIPH